MNNAIKQDLYDIYEMWHIPFWQTRWFYLSVSCIVFLLLLLTVYLVMKKFKKEKPKTSWEKAIAALQGLKQQNLDNSEQCKQFYGLLTRILKTYLQDRFGYQIRGKTDYQVIEYLQSSSFPKPLLSLVQEVLEGSIFIKFAPVKAAQEQINASFKDSMAIITKTIPPRK